MPTSFAFDPTLNNDRCFRNTPPLRFEVNNLPKRPRDWLTELENKCRDVETNLEKNIFLKHVGQKSNYKSKTSLLEQLSLIYCRISGHLDKPLGLLDSESSKLLLLELIEDIQQCTPGFHIRVNKLVNSFYTPKTLDQLLYLVRKSSIEEIAASLTNQVGIMYQVHVANRVSQVAKKMGLGIEANIQKEQYKSLLSGDKIRERLKNEFPKQYTAFKIPYLLAEQLQLILNLHQYQGAKKEYYTSELAENLVSVIKKFYSVPDIQNKHFKDFFILKPDQFGDPTLFYDINWPLIRHFFFQNLIHDNYFTEKPAPGNLLEYAYFLALMLEKANLTRETQFINRCLCQKNYIELIDSLILIHDKFPDYWKKLIKNSLVINNIQNFFKCSMAQFDNSTHANELQKKLNHIYTVFFSQTHEFILKAITSLKSDQFNLLLKSIRYCPEVTKLFLNQILAIHPSSFFELLFTQNNLGNNLLMFSGRYHAETTQFILDSMSKHMEDIEKQKISLLLSIQNEDNWSLLSLAAIYQPGAIKFILDFIKQYPQIFDTEQITTLFYQKNLQNHNFLQLLVSYQSDSYVNVCLEFIEEKFGSSDKRPWLKLFLNHSAGNFLRLAAQSNLNTLNSILIFIDRYIDQVDNLEAFFLETYENSWHCLHLAARYNFSNLNLILDFLQKHIRLFSSDTVCHLFLAPTNSHSNFIHIAVRYQPRSIDQIFKFIIQNIQFFNKAMLKKLFLQQNSDGWNFLGGAFLHPVNTAIILDFIKQHNTQFDPETIHQIILQKNKYSYNCLHLSARFQPDSLKIILNFIEPHIELFAKALNLSFQSKESNLWHIRRLFQRPQPQDKQKNLLDLSLEYQSESALLFFNLLNRHPKTFNLESQIIKKFISQASKLKSENPTNRVDLTNTPFTQLQGP